MKSLPSLEELENREQRRRRLNTRTFPTLRLVGCVMLALLVTLHEFLLPEVPHQLDWLWTVPIVYALVAGAVLIFGYSASGVGKDLASVLFSCDVLLFTWAIYISGGPESWLFPILFVRLADQTNFSIRRVVWFTHLITLSYAGMLVYCWSVGQEFHEGTEIFKLFLLYFSGLYISFTAGTGEVLRRRMAEAIKVARSAIENLERSNRDLRVARLEAETAVRTREAFIRGASHELRTPLNGILGFCQMLAADINPKKRERYLSNIQTSGDRLLTLVDKLLLLTGIESDQLEFESLDFHELIQPLIQEATQQAQEKSVDIVYEAKTFPSIEVDRKRILELCRHLLKLETAKSEENGKISIRLTNDSDEVHLVIESTHSQQLEDDSGFDKALLTALAEMHGGRLTLENGPNDSCSWTLVLPRDK